MYEVTIFEAEDEDSFDEDTEITEAVRQVRNTESRMHTQGSNRDCVPLRIIGDVSSVTSWTPPSPETACAAGRYAVIGYPKSSPNLPRRIPKPSPLNRMTNQQPTKLLVSHINAGGTRAPPVEPEEEMHRVLLDPSSVGVTVINYRR